MPFSTTFLGALGDEYCIEPYIPDVDNILGKSSDVLGPAWGAFMKRISYLGGKGPLTDIEIAMAKPLKSGIGFCQFSGHFCYILTYLAQFLKEEEEAVCVGSHFLLRVVLDCRHLLDHFVDAGLGTVLFTLN